jgi:hypothetical protein
MEDDFLGEPLDRVAESIATSSGRAGIQGVEARALAGDIRVSVQDDTQSRHVGHVVNERPG